MLALEDWDRIYRFVRKHILLFNEMLDKDSSNRIASLKEHY